MDENATRSVELFSGRQLSRGNFSLPRTALNHLDSPSDPRSAIVADPEAAPPVQTPPKTLFRPILWDHTWKMLPFARQLYALSTLVVEGLTNLLIARKLFTPDIIEIKIRKKQEMMFFFKVFCCLRKRLHKNSFSRISSNSFSRNKAFLGTWVIGLGNNLY